MVVKLQLEPRRGAYLLLFYNPSRSICAVEKEGYFNSTRCTDEADSPAPRVLSITRCTCRATCFQELQDNDYQLHVFPGTRQSGIKYQSARLATGLPIGRNRVPVIHGDQDGLARAPLVRAWSTVAQAAVHTIFVLSLYGNIAFYP